MTFEVVMKKGFGGPYYVEAENADEAMRRGIARFRYHQTAMDNWPASHCIEEVRAYDKAAVQYA